MPSTERDPFDLAGETIDGKYRAISVVGEGGFGVVYRGLHEGFEAPIAIKCLKLPPHFDLAAQEELVRKLREEGRLLLRLSQRTSGIVQALDVGSFTSKNSARVPYLILEWLEGQTLADWLRARRAKGERGMSTREAFAILEPAARALAVAHDEKIAHRDIKPENLFMVESGGRSTLKILDFGIAKILAEAPTPGEAQTGAMPSAFTPSYGAPEQFEKRRGASGPWTDVFAMALVFVELVTGSRALEGDELIDLFHASIDDVERPTPQRRGIDVGKPVEDALKRALSPDPTGRYREIGAFWADLEAAIAMTKDASGSLSKPPAISPETEGLPTAEYLGASGLPIEPPPAVTDPAMKATALAAEIDMAAAATAKSEPINESPPKPAEPAAPLRSEAAQRRRLGLVAAGVAVLFAGVGYFTSKAPAPTTPTGTSSASASAPTPASAAPLSKNPEAAALYNEARAALHDGKFEAALRTLERAVALDRELGAAHVRLAMIKLERSPDEAKEHYLAAARVKGSLDERDAGLVEALEAIAREPPDYTEWLRRLEALAAKRPEDTEILTMLANARLVQLRFDDAVASADRALALDRTLVPAWLVKADALGFKGDLQGQLAAYKACLDSSPIAAAPCLSLLADVHARAGDCAAMRDDAKRLLLLDAKSTDTYGQLAAALYATGAPKDSVLEALGRRSSVVPRPYRTIRDLEDRANLAAADGDFEAARRSIEEWVSFVADKPDQMSHGAPALALARVLFEMGQAKKAGEVAGDFIRRMGAWSESTLGDWSIGFPAYQLRGGAIRQDEYVQSRSRWLDTVRSKRQTAGLGSADQYDWLIWSTAFADPAVETKAEAEAAIEGMPKAKSLAVEGGRWPSVDLIVGKAYVLAGRFEPAIAPLRRAATSCFALPEPFLSPTAALYLGMALEGKGDDLGAKAAYEKVIDRWGKAKPKSITAEAAKRRLDALKSKKP